jgi:hypothetical protein
MPNLNSDMESEPIYDPSDHPLSGHALDSQSWSCWGIEGFTLDVTCVIEKGL